MFLADFSVQIAVTRGADTGPGALGTQGSSVQATVVSQAGVKAVAELVREALRVREALHTPKKRNLNI